MWKLHTFSSVLCKRCICVVLLLNKKGMHTSPSPIQNTKSFKKSLTSTFSLYVSATLFSLSYRSREGKVFRWSMDRVDPRSRSVRVDSRSFTLSPHCLNGQELFSLFHQLRALTSGNNGNFGEAVEVVDWENH